MRDRPPPDAARLLIVNADDFGLTEGVNRGIVRAHEHGVVTSASLLVRHPAADDAAAYARGRPQLSVGLHLDLGEWVYRDGEWSALYEVVPVDDAAAVAEEARRQLEWFVRLVEHPPTHLDSHQHVHRTEPVLSVARALAAELNVPLRHFSHRVHYRGDFYGQGPKGQPIPEGITPAALARLIDGLSPGVTELACHPGLDDTSPLAYGRERALEVAALCDASVRQAVSRAGVRLIGFGQL